MAVHLNPNTNIGVAMETRSETRKMPPPQASARQTEMGETFNKVLFSALDALQEFSIPYALIGGIAASGLGRPRSTHDIDIFVRPDDAEAALEALAKHGFEPERTDPRWLFKGWKDEMMVDIIFKSSGDIYFDNEMYEHAKPVSYHGRLIPTVAPEDLIVIKAAVHSEIGPHHWHDALAILSHAEVDWTYLLKRSRRASRRILALLIYAQSNDIWIPNHVVNELYLTIFAGAHQGSQQASPQAAHSHGAHSHIQNTHQTHTIGRSGSTMSHESSKAQSHTKAIPETYLRGHLMEALAQNLGTASLDVDFVVGGNRIVMKGECPSPDHRSAIEAVVREEAHGYSLDNQMKITQLRDPEAEEVIQ